MLKEIILKVQAQIAQGNLELALDTLTMFLSRADGASMLLQDAIAIKSRLNQHTRALIKGTLQHGEAILEKNQIANAILLLLGVLSEQEKSLIGQELFKVEAEKALGHITVLFVAANPSGTARLRLEEELRDVGEELQRARHRERFSLISIHAARISDLENALLDHAPNLIHFTGHGTQQGIILHSHGEAQVIVNNESIARLFKLFSDNLACVFLSSCYSEIQGRIINQFVPMVIGMRDQVPQHTAMAFSKAFYKSLGAGRTIDFSFEFAKNSIGTHNLSGEDLPVLLQN